MSEKIEARDILECLWNEKKSFDKETIVKCPECKELVKVSDFIETESYCEDCGSHLAIECPKCSAIFDIIWSEEDFSIPE